MKKKTKADKLEDLEFAIDSLFGEISTRQYKELWKIAEDIKMDYIIEEEENHKNIWV